jgi:hypothetical protein
LEELGNTMSAHEFGLWAAAYDAEPWGEWRTDYAGGIVAATFANINRRANAPAFSPADFMPKFRRAEASEPTPAEWAKGLNKP